MNIANIVIMIGWFDRFKNCILSSFFMKIPIEKYNKGSVTLRPVGFYHMKKEVVQTIKIFQSCLIQNEKGEAWFPNKTCLV